MKVFFSEVPYQLGENILYENRLLAQVLTPDDHTEIFQILAGVLQGDTLSPFLFIIALDYVFLEDQEKNTLNLGLPHIKASITQLLTSQTLTLQMILHYSPLLFKKHTIRNSSRSSRPTCQLQENKVHLGQPN